MSDIIPIVTPTHKDYLSAIEIQRINLTLVSNPSSPHIFVIPESISSENLMSAFPDSQTISKPHHFFTSINAYNSLMLSKEFYVDFQPYKHILISQTDSFVVRDITLLAKLGFPYMGASWNPSFKLTPIGKRIFVNRNFPKIINSFELHGGNGGLSLRNVNVMLNILKRGLDLPESRSFMHENTRRINEDLAISYLCLKFGHEMPSRDTLNQIFVETNSRQTYNKDTVFGFHGLDKHQPDIESSLLSYYQKKLNLLGSD